MTARAALPMYDWPEMQAETDGFYARLRALVPELPTRLTRPATATETQALWRNPSLVLGQTCWGPLDAGLSAWVSVLAQPTYDDVQGGRGSMYRSAVVMRAGSEKSVPIENGANLPPLDNLKAAINAADSMSGAIALAEDSGNRDLVAGAIVTGSHRGSIRAVAEGSADIAAIDCRSWALARTHEPAAKRLVVVGWTALRLGLPFVTSRKTKSHLRKRLADALCMYGAERPLSIA